MTRQRILPLIGLLFLLTIAILCTSSLASSDTPATQMTEVTPEISQAGVPSSIPLNKLFKKISFFLVYPEEAKRNNWGGIVKITFTIKKDGRIESARISQSCGYPLLDNAALWAIQNASLYPFPINKDTELTLPISFGEDSTVAQATKPTKYADSSSHNLNPIHVQEIDIIENTAPLSITRTKPSPPTRPKKTTKAKTLATETKISPLEDINLEKLVSGSFTPELKNLVAISMENNQPLQIAREEMALARIKIKEAKRNMYSSAKIEVYAVEGADSRKVDYEEQELKLNVTHPLYYANRFRNAKSQSEVNLEITRKNYDQQMLETIHNTEAAYYNLIALKMNMEKQDELIKEAGKILDVIGRQHEENVIIPLDFRSAQSFYQQLRLLKDSIEHELQMGNLTLKQTVNSDTLPPIKTQHLSVKEFNISLKDCTETALRYRPEITLAHLNVEFAEYGKKIEESKNKLSVDLTTSYGLYRGHFLTESYTESSNWYLGLKATKPFGASTLTTTLATEESEPRYGETSPSETRTLMGEFGILDNIKKDADIKQSEIEFLKSTTQLSETEKSVVFEVQDAFLNYKKSLLELKSSLSMRNFKEEKLLITKIRSSAGEDTFSNVMQTIVDLSGAENTYLRSLGNYYISLTRLRKATGYGLKI